MNKFTFIAFHNKKGSLISDSLFFHFTSTLLFFFSLLFANQALCSHASLVFEEISTKQITELIAQANKKHTKGVPYQYGIPIEKKINFSENATHNTNYQSLSITFQHAENLSLILSEYDLQNDELLIINGENNEQYTYTTKHKNATGKLGTSTVSGSTIHIHFYSKRNTSLIIDRIIFGFRKPYNENKKLNESANCHHDIQCPEGDDWQNEKKGIALIALGGYTCSGSLINNTIQDNSPYFLAANHCLSSFPEVETWVFRFNYESPSPSCADLNLSQEPATPFHEIHGATLRANNNQSDFCLLELLQLPTDFPVYYNGWTTELNTEDDVVSIHHPQGDVKKISGTANYHTETFEGVSCLKIAQWNFGATEGGSSGAPLFNSQKQIIGQLYGGYSSCINTSPNTSADYFGAFYASWQHETEPKNQLKSWLNPTSSPTNHSSGSNFSPHNLDAKIHTAHLADVLCNTDSAQIHITLRNLGNTPITSARIEIKSSQQTLLTDYQINIQTGAISEELTLPFITIASPYDTLKIRLLEINNQTDDIVENNYYEHPITNFQQAVNGTLHFTTDCYGSESSWILYDEQNNAILSEGPYYDYSETKIEITPLCLPIGCYTLLIKDVFGDGLSGNGCNQSGDVALFFQNKPIQQLSNPNFGYETSLEFCVTENLETAQNHFTTFPNPAENFITIKNHAHQAIETTISIYNTKGSLIDTLHYFFLPTSTKTLSLTNLPNAVYFLKIESALGLQIIKFVKL